MQLELARIKKLGASLIAVTPETPDNSLTAIEKNNLEFEVLSDLGNKVARHFGIVFTLPEDLRPIYAGFGIDIPKANGDSTFQLPIPATYVISLDRKIRRVFVDPDHTKRLDPEDIIETLEEIVQEAGNGTNIRKSRICKGLYGKDMHTGRVIAVCTSRNKGTPKTDIRSGFLEVGFGLSGDAHGGEWHRQVSLLSVEQIRIMEDKGLDVRPGSFAENITTEGFNLDSVTVGDRLKIGESAVVEVTQIGKECHTRCAIYHKVGECIMPEQGVFAKVVVEGEVKVGDSISQ